MEKKLLEKGGRGLVRQNGELSYYIEVSLKIPDAAYEKYLDVLIFTLPTNMYYKIIAYVKYEMTGNAVILIVLIVITAVLIIHANNKIFS